MLVRCDVLYRFDLNKYLLAVAHGGIEEVAYGVHLRGELGGKLEVVRSFGG